MTTSTPMKKSLRGPIALFLLGFGLGVLGFLGPLLIAVDTFGDLASPTASRLVKEQSLDGAFAAHRFGRIIQLVGLVVSGTGGVWLLIRRLRLRQ